MRIAIRLLGVMLLLGLLLGSGFGLVFSSQPTTLAYMHDGALVAGASLTAGAPEPHVSTLCSFFASAASGQFKVSGTSYTFETCVHSNGNVAIGGNTHQFKGTIYHVGAYSSNDNGHTFGSVLQAEAQPPPHQFDASLYARSGCKGSAADARGEWFYHTSNRVTITQPGIHVFDRSAEADLGGFSGAVTLVSSAPLTISLASSQATPYVDGLLAHTSHAGSNTGISLNTGDGAVARGIISSPDSRVDLSIQGGMTFYGQVVAHSIELTGGSGSVFHGRDFEGPTAC